METAPSPLSLGQIVATQNALDTIPTFTMLTALERHERGDWGELCPEDRAENERALREGNRILSVYTTPGDVKFWIITEHDRSITTVLLPEDY